jgi:3-hydroxyisobutyrate dehydrogenase
MGSRMSANLVKDGYDLRVFDIQEDAVEELVELGAEGAESAEELARQCDVVMLSLPGPDQVVQVVDDIRAGLEAGDVVIDLTTSTPATTNALGEELESKAVDVLSAPVSGGRSGAENATLSVMVGGDRDVFEACRPLFDAIGSDVFYIGDQHGDGHAMKLVNNYLSFVAMICTAEAVSIGEEVGLELETMIDVFNQSSARNTATTYKYPEHVIPGEYDMNYEMGLVEKDMQLLMDVSRDTGVPFMVGGTIRQMIAYIRAELGKDADYTEIYKYFDEIAADGAKTAKK